MKEESKEKLSVIKKLAYGMGAIAHNFMGNGIGALALPIYNIGLGVNAALIGLALGIPRIWDAVNDPMMGHISDNTRSRWGRRRPYILIGGILCGVAFVLLWCPNPAWSKTGLFAFFLAASIFYYTVFTVWGIPYGALGYELSYDYKERTNIQAYKTFLACVFGLSLPWIYKMCFWSWDKLTSPQACGLIQRISELTQKSGVKGAEIGGARYVGIIFGIIIIIAAIIPVWCKERAEVQVQEKMSFLNAFKSTFQNKPYVILTMAGFLAFFGLFLVQPLGLYINIYYVMGGDREAAATMNGWAGTVYTMAGILSIPLVTKLAHILGKKRAFLWGLGLTMIGYVSIWWLFTPANPWLQVLPFILIGPAWNCCMIVLPSMVADVCDLDEMKTGLRREGMYGAINSLIMKIGIAAVTCATGVVVAVVGVNPEASRQTADTILKMRLAFVGLPLIFMLSALLFSARYPITEEKAIEVRKMLDERKKKLSDVGEYDPSHV